MKIGLVTIHRANNYGAVLQAFASQEILARFGEVDVLDHRNPYIGRTLEVVRVDPELRAVFRVAKDLLRFLPRRRVVRKFLNFIDTKLRVVRFDESNRLLISERYDVFVSGSDQIWNPTTVSANNQFDPVYFLSFAGKKKKVAYASSMGSYKLDAEKTNQLKSHLSSYASLSARESGTAESLTKILGRKVEHLLDPTLLLKKEEWIKALNVHGRTIAGEYILVFALKKDALFKESVKAISTSLGKRVVAIDQDPILGFEVDLHISDAGPEDFIEIFNNASFVITNSFHGTAFAINFGLPFAAVLPPTGGNRVVSLLQATGLSDRLVSDVKDLVTTKYSDVDFSFAHGSLDEQRKAAFKYLADALSVE